MSMFHCLHLLRGVYMNSNILKSVGQRIRDIRKQKGLTQEELGEICEFHYTYVGAVERAEKNISLINLQKLADALEVQVQELFKYESYTTRSLNEREEIIFEINEHLMVMKNQDLKKVRLFLTEIMKSK